MSGRFITVDERAVLQELETRRSHAPAERAHLRPAVALRHDRRGPARLGHHRRRPQDAEERPRRPAHAAGSHPVDAPGARHRREHGLGRRARAEISRPAISGLRHDPSVLRSRPRAPTRDFQCAVAAPFSVNSHATCAREHAFRDQSKSGSERSCIMTRMQTLMVTTVLAAAVPLATAMAQSSTSSSAAPRPGRRAKMAYTNDSL